MLTNEPDDESDSPQESEQQPADSLQPAEEQQPVDSDKPAAQPLYDQIAASSEALVFRRTRAFTHKIHHHRGFLVPVPTGNVIKADNG